MRHIVTPRIQYSLEGATGTTQTIPLCCRIDSSSWTSAVLTVRLHSKTGSSSSAAITVSALAVSIPPDDPATTFLTSGAALATTGSLTLNSESAPRLYTASFSGAIPESVMVSLSYAQGGTGGAWTFAISVDIEARTG